MKSITGLGCSVLLASCGKVGAAGTPPAYVDALRCAAATANSATYDQIGVALSGRQRGVDDSASRQAKQAWANLAVQAGAAVGKSKPQVEAEIKTASEGGDRAVLARLRAIQARYPGKVGDDLPEGVRRGIMTDMAAHIDEQNKQAAHCTAILGTMSTVSGK